MNSEGIKMKWKKESIHDIPVTVMFLDHFKEGVCISFEDLEIDYMSLCTTWQVFVYPQRYI